MRTVSIIVPVYNVERYIDKCLRSIINQTLQNIEVIIVNDGSTDGSQNIIDKYASKYNDKIISLRKENGGLADARNYGLRYASGEYVGFVDSDDWIEPDMYEKLYKCADQKKADIVISDFIFEPDSNVIHTNITEGTSLTLTSHPSLLLTEASVCNKLFKRSLFTENNIEFPKGKLHEDRLAICKLYYFADNIVYIREGLYHYLKGRGNSITTSVNMKKYNDILISLESIYCFFEEVNYTSKISRDLDTLFVNTYIAFSMKAIRELKSSKEKEKFLNNFRELILSKTSYPMYLDSHNKKYSRKLLLYLLLHKRYNSLKLLIRVKKILRG